MSLESTTRRLAALAAKLPDLRIGTVDKFQGQEAPIYLYSMSTSSADEAPYGLQFLYSLNRLNVATSRAQCLAVVVASPGLLTTGENEKGVLMLKKGDYDEYLLGLAREVGYPEELEFNYMVGDIEIQATIKLFDDEGFTIRKATEQDFNELKFEMDELLRD